jgi:hypothetical protein
MLYRLTPEDRLDRLEEQLRQARSVTPALISAVIAGACVRLPALGRGEQVARLDRLIGSGGWTDAAFALIELELPAWKLRRLVYEDDAWLCSLSKQPNLPMELDEAAEASHGDLALAMLSAFIDARRGAATCSEPSARRVPQVRPQRGQAVCCDNFA